MIKNYKNLNQFRKFFLILTFFVLFVCIPAEVIGQNVRYPSYTGWVNDYARIINSADNAKISSLIQEVKERTGAEIAVVTVRDMQGLSIEEYAVGLYEAWAIGQAGKDNGVLLILAMQEREARIEVGYGLEGIIPDGRAGQILNRDMIPKFTTGAYGEGFYAGVQSIAEFIAEEYDVTLSEQHVRSAPAGSASESGRGTSLCGIIFIIFLIIITRGRIIPWLLISGMAGGGRRSSFGGGGSFGGGFGGFGGGMSGGGGASGSF